MLTLLKQYIWNTIYEINTSYLPSGRALLHGMLTQDQVQFDVGIKTTQGQYSAQVQPQQARLVSCLLYGTLAMLAQI